MRSVNFNAVNFCLDVEKGLYHLITSYASSNEFIIAEITMVGGLE